MDIQNSQKMQQDNSGDVTKKILLVEDDEFLSVLIKNKLLKRGVSVLYAKDGEEAIKVLEKNKPDLILLDLILPKMSGFEVMRRMRENPQIESIPIIVISNLGQPEDVQKGKNLGAIEYFVKAKISIDDLINNILNFFN